MAVLAIFLPTISEHLNYHRGARDHQEVRVNGKLFAQVLLPLIG